MQGTAPHVRQTVGRWALIDSVDNYSFTTSTNNDVYILVSWLSAATAALRFDKTAGSGGFVSTLTHRGMSQLQSAAPLQIRPLRMSFELKNTTQVVNRAGSATFVPIDQPLRLGVVYPVASSGLVSFDVATGNSLEVMSTDTNAAHTYTADELAKGRKAVSVPTAWAPYNEFHNFKTVSSADGNLTGIDANALFNGEFIAPGESEPYPVYGTPTTVLASTGPALSPPLRGWLVRIPATATAQSYVAVFRRQDACRAAANSFVNSVARPHMPASAEMETRMISSATHVSGMEPQSTNVLDQAKAGLAQAAGFAAGQKVLSFLRNGATAVEEGALEYGPLLAELA